MATKNPKKIVVDASVARAAGSAESIHPTGALCREFLTSFRKQGHFLIVTPDIRAEWRKHQSAFAQSWYVKIVASRCQIWLEEIEDEELRKSVKQLKIDSGIIKAMIKDIHLIEAALKSDQIVASLDETVRKYFSRSSEIISEFCGIIWVNPSEPKETAIIWLNAGAKVELMRTLKAFRQP
jgi:hypothetical protein